jgi:hypothetical protein
MTRSCTRGCTRETRRQAAAHSHRCGECRRWRPTWRRRGVALGVRGAPQVLREASGHIGGSGGSSDMPVHDGPSSMTDGGAERR